MVVGFLKGIWGKPAQPATGLHGIWGTITNIPENIFGAIMTPAKIIKWVIIGVVGIFVYNSIIKK